MSRLIEYLPLHQPLTLIKDNENCLGHFVLLSFIKQSQLNNQPICILSTEHTRDHWLATSKKLGSPLPQSTPFIEALNTLADSPSPQTLSLLLDNIKNAISQKPNESPFKLLVDDLSCLYWLGIDGKSVQGFLCELVKISDQNDVELVIIEHTPSNNDYLTSMSSTIIQTEPLATGPSAEVTGQIKAYRGPLWISERKDQWIGWEKQFLLNDNGLDVFAKGLGRSDKATLAFDIVPHVQQHEVNFNYLCI